MRIKGWLHKLPKLIEDNRRGENKAKNHRNLYEYEERLCGERVMSWT
jgi:hypothetical protein